MTFLNYDHPEVQRAIHDIRALLKGHSDKIVCVSLFGSTLSTKVNEAQDIDFLVSFRNGDYQNIKNDILMKDIGRKVVVQRADNGYSNHPDWPRELPIPLHILFYDHDKSNLKPKMMRTRDTAIDITDLVLK